jgi:hypothetical protein
MLRLQVREIRGWLSGGNQKSGTPPMDSYTQNDFWLDSRSELEVGLDAVELVPDDEPIRDAAKAQFKPSH